MEKDFELNLPFRFIECEDCHQYGPALKGRCPDCGHPFQSKEIHDEWVEARRQLLEPVMELARQPHRVAPDSSARPPLADPSEEASKLLDELATATGEFFAAVEGVQEGTEEEAKAVEAALRELKTIEARSQSVPRERTWTEWWNSWDALMKVTHDIVSSALGALTASTPDAAARQMRKVEQATAAGSYNARRIAELVRAPAGFPGSGPVVTPRDAEALARDWMRASGFRDARLTGGGADAGIDVVSRGAVAQVKAHQRPVGRPEIQQLHGVASIENKEGIFFSLSGYTDQAMRWANSAGIALVTFDAAGRITPRNRKASELRRRAEGLPSPPTTGQRLADGLKWYVGGLLGVGVLAGTWRVVRDEGAFWSSFWSAIVVLLLLTVILGLTFWWAYLKAQRPTG